MISGDPDARVIKGQVKLRLELPSCDLTQASRWNMNLFIAEGRLDVDDSDYDGDGTKNSEERGDGNPEWDPFRFS